MNKAATIAGNHSRAEHAEHYNHERNHQGIENQLITEPETGLPESGPIRKRERLGGMLQYHYREAA
ncbi:MAG: hypothetical protein GY946_24040 [bacterium]|nr:hypothetical protein [bacterium]